MRISCAGTLIYYLTLPARKVATLSRDSGFPIDVHAHLLTDLLINIIFSPIDYQWLPETRLLLHGPLHINIDYQNKPRSIRIAKVYFLIGLSTSIRPLLFANTAAARVPKFGSLSTFEGFSPVGKGKESAPVVCLY